MLAALMWIILVVGIFMLAFYQASARNGLILSAVLLVIATPFTAVWFAIILWIVWLLLTLFILFPVIRYAYFSKPMLHWFLRKQPALSQAEREVLESGGIWWEKEFFTGNPNWEKLLHGRDVVMNAEEQAFLAGPVEKLCAMLNDWQITVNKDMPKAVWDFIKKEKFWGLTIPKKYNGHGFSAIAHSTIITKIASRSMSAAINIMVPNSLGPATFLECFGTEEQKNYYLPRLATGEEVSCFALTSLEAGSDAASITDLGVVCYGHYNGEQVLGVKLNFEKRYITLAPISTLIGLAFRLQDPQHLLGSATDVGITCAMVPANLPGIERGHRHLPMNLAFLNGPIRGKDVFIPLNMIVGGAHGAGAGWRMLMECLALGRGISLPSLATAVNQLCFRATSAYVQVRRQFKHPIGEFEGVANGLAKIGGFSYLSEATRIFTAGAVDAGQRPSIASAIAKFHLTELARVSANIAMDIHGGRAIQQGPRNYLGAVYTAIPISITVEGANILTRNLIIFGQGVVRCHPYLKDEMQVIQETNEKIRLKNFDRLLLKHIGFSVSRMARTFWYGLTGGRFIRTCRRGKLHTFLQQLTRLSAAFAFLTDMTLLVMGAKLKFRESLSARFGDIISYLYMASAVIRRYEQRGEVKEEAPFLEWSLTYCLAKIQQSFDNILHNYPKKFLGKLLWRILFPYGNVYRLPTDVCSQKVAELMQTDSSLRNELTQHCYVGVPPDPVAIVDSVFQRSAKIKSLLKSIPGASGHPDLVLLQELHLMRENKQFNEEDFTLLQAFLLARLEAIQVDEFNNGREVNEPKHYYTDTKK